MNQTNLLHNKRLAYLKLGLFIAESGKRFDPWLALAQKQGRIAAPAPAPQAPAPQAPAPQAPQKQPDVVNPKGSSSKKPSFLDQAKGLAGKFASKAKEYGAKGLDYAKKNPLETLGGAIGGAVGGATGGLGGAYVGARSGASLGGMAKKGIGLAKAGIENFKQEREKQGGTFGALKSYASKGKDFIKNDALNLADRLGGKAIDYARQNPGEAAARLAGGVAGGVMGGGLGGAFTGQAAGGRMAQGVKTIGGAARQWNQDRKTKGVWGATKANIGTAAKGALDVGAGAMAFKGMHDKYQDRKASDDAYNRETIDRERGVGRGLTPDDRDTQSLESDAAQKGLGGQISKQQIYDRQNKVYIDNNSQSDTYGRRSYKPFVNQNSDDFRTGSVTTVGGKSTFNDPTTELAAQRSRLDVQKLQAQGQDSVDYSTMRKAIRQARGVQDTAIDSAGGVAGATMGAGAIAGQAAQRPGSGKTASQYVRGAGSKVKGLFNRLRGKK